MWLTDGFSVTFFGRWRGQCTHVNSRVAHVWLPYTVINVWGGGTVSIGKLGKFEKLQFLIKVVGSISGHFGAHEL